MKNHLILISGILFWVVSANAKNISATNGSKVLNFKQNIGQVCDQNSHSRPDVLFSGTDGQFVFHLKNNGVSYQLQHVDKWRTNTSGNNNTDLVGINEVPDEISIYRIDINWINANPFSREFFQGRKFCRR